MAALFSGDVSSNGVPLPHVWEHTVGSGHATLALRADWQASMRRAHDELGMRHVRFHGILDDDMGTLICQSEAFIYSFFNADQIMDFLLSIGMKPFVELSFMPSTLASGGQIVFHYRANVSAPRHLTEWSTLITRLVSHWVDRYGIDEVRQWFFEVWNEPNLLAFGNANQAEYFDLYRCTAQAIKAIDSQLQVGGPATADNEWIADMVHFCSTNGVPIDFISTHHYPTDAFGRPGDDTDTQLSESTRSALREEARQVRTQAGRLPVYYTEWCTSSNPRDHFHDEPFAAAMIVKTVLEANGLVDGYSYWTFSDIFEENYFPSVPFHGGFGLLNLHGIAKPAFRAFELLHAIGTELLPLQGTHETVDAWLVRDATGVTVMLTNFALPRHDIFDQTVRITLRCERAPATISVRRIDDEHANVKRHWLDMGSPEYLSTSALADLHAASALSIDTLPFVMHASECQMDLNMPAQSVAAIRVTW
jgi:xylan 1,4-beta-xylosidase